METIEKLLTQLEADVRILRAELGATGATDRLEDARVQVALHVAVNATKDADALYAAMLEAYVR